MLLTILLAKLTKMVRSRNTIDCTLDVRRRELRSSSSHSREFGASCVRFFIESAATRRADGQSVKEIKITNNCFVSTCCVAFFSSVQLGFSFGGLWRPVLGFPGGKCVALLSFVDFSFSFGDLCRPIFGFPGGKHVASFSSVGFGFSFGGLFRPVVGFLGGRCVASFSSVKFSFSFGGLCRPVFGFPGGKHVAGFSFGGLFRPVFGSPLASSCLSPRLSP
jgi:hypothetical protein